MDHAIILISSHHMICRHHKHCHGFGTCSIMKFCSVDMDARYYIISVACDTMEFEFILLSPLLVWSTPLDLPKRCGISGIRIKIRIRR